MASINSIWLWASCSEHLQGVLARRRRIALTAVLVSAGVVGSATAWAKVYLTREEALRRAFGHADVTRESVFLTDDQIESARQRAGERAEVRRPLVTRYRARRDGVTIGTAYLDTHRVRTLDQTILVVVDPGGRLARVDILAFAEPEEYLPREGWLEQYRGRILDHDLRIKRGIHGITGATLSSEATTAAVRRILAVHEVIEESRSASPEGAP